MAFSVRNVEKFVGDHPELGLSKDAILERAKTMVETGTNVLVGMVAYKLFEPATAKLFFHEITSDAEHIRMGEEDLEALGGEVVVIPS